MWAVVYTKLRQESKAKENLDTLGFETFLPNIPVEKIKKGKIETVTEPLFPRYVFIRSNTKQFKSSHHIIRNVKGVSKLITYGSQIALLSEKAIEEIEYQSNISSKQTLKRFNAGDKVKFSFGAFREVEAIFKETDGNARVILMFEILNKSTDLSIPVKAIASN